jgi:hypothetical protein
LISVGSEVQVLPGPPSYFGGAEIRSPGGIEKRLTTHCVVARRRVSDASLSCLGGAVGILSRGGVAQWESTCFASRGSSVRIRPSPFLSAPRGVGGSPCESAARTVEGLVCCPLGGGTSETRPWALSGILEREPGGAVGEHVLSHGEDDQLCVRVTHIVRGKT